MIVKRTIFAFLLYLVSSTLSYAVGPEFILDSTRMSNNQYETLTGKWWFHWNDYLTPAEAVKAYKNDTLPKIDVPSYWNDYVSSDPENPYLHGKASYLARITVDQRNDIALTLRAPLISDAYQIIWIPLDAPDEWVEVATEGQMSGEFLPAMRNLDHPLPKLVDGLLLINVQKEVFFWSGLVSTLSVGETNTMADEKFIDHLIRGILIGALTLIILQSLLQYFYSEGDTSALILAALSATLALRAVLLTGIVEVTFTEAAHITRMHVEYMTIILPGTLALHFHASLIPGFIYPIILRTSWIVTGVVCILTLLIPTDVMSDYLYWYQSILVANILILLASLIRGTWLNLRYARIISIGSLVMLVGGTNDIIAANMDNYGLVLIDYAMIIFMLVQSQIVGRRINYAVARSKRLEKEKKKLEKAHKEAVKSSMHDHLTGLLNRQALDELFLQSWDRAKRQRDHIAVVIFDIDHFKNVNDTYGHLIGDEILVFIASLLQKYAFRKNDFVCRYGGEEFVLVLPSTELREACAVAERLRIKIMNSIASHILDEKIYITCSFGVASMNPTSGNKPKELLKLADDALYEAKGGGRNCVMYKTGTLHAEKESFL